MNKRQRIKVLRTSAQRFIESEEIADAEVKLFIKNVVRLYSDKQTVLVLNRYGFETLVAANFNRLLIGAARGLQAALGKLSPFETGGIVPEIKPAISYERVVSGISGAGNRMYLHKIAE